jgi:hypothetical protein
MEESRRRRGDAAGASAAHGLRHPPAIRHPRARLACYPPCCALSLRRRSCGLWENGLPPACSSPALSAFPQHTAHPPPPETHTHPAHTHTHTHTHAHTRTHTRTHQEWRLRLAYLLLETLGALRTGDMFDAAVDYPDSAPAIADLAECLRHTVRRFGLGRGGGKGWAIGLAGRGGVALVGDDVMVRRWQVAVPHGPPGVLQGGKGPG